MRAIEAEHERYKNIVGVYVRVAASTPLIVGCCVFTNSILFNISWIFVLCESCTCALCLRVRASVFVWLCSRHAPSHRVCYHKAKHNHERYELMCIAHMHAGTICAYAIYTEHRIHKCTRPAIRATRKRYAAAEPDSGLILNARQEREIERESNNMGDVEKRIASVQIRSRIAFAPSLFLPIRESFRIQNIVLSSQRTLCPI